MSSAADSQPMIGLPPLAVIVPKNLQSLTELSSASETYLAFLERIAGPHAKLQKIKIDDTAIFND